MNAPAGPPAPSTVASVASVQNFGGFLGATASPLVAGIIVDATGSFNVVFMTSAAVAVLSAVFYHFLVKRPIISAEDVAARNAAEVEEVLASKITSVDTSILKSTLEKPFAYSQGWVEGRSTTVVRIRTDDGLEGWGQTFSVGLQPPAIAASVIESALKPLILGKDPRQTNVLWDIMYVRIPAGRLRLLTHEVPARQGRTQHPDRRRRSRIHDVRVP